MTVPLALIIEDDQDLANIFAEALEAAGYENPWSQARNYCRFWSRQLWCLICIYPMCRVELSCAASVPTGDWTRPGLCWQRLTRY